MSEVLMTPEQETDTYSVNDIVSLLITSFRFARGDGSMQYGALSFIADTYHDRFGDLSVLDEALPGAQQTGIETYKRLHLKSTADNKLGEQVAKDEMTIYVDKLRSFLEDGAGAYSYSPLSEFATNVISADRKLHDKFEAADPKPRAVDEFSSNLVTYALLGRASGRHEGEYNSAGREEFNAAFEAVGRLILDETSRLRYDDPIEGALQIKSVFDAHLAVHPADSQPLADAIAGTNLETFLQPATAAG